MSVDYNNFAKKFSNSRINMKWEEIDYFLSFLKWKAWTILDVGCWNGRFLSHIKEKELDFSDYLWVDLSEWLLEEASELYPNSRFLHLDMIDLDKISDKFDFIFFIASFHHLDKIEDRLEVLNKVKNLLKKDWMIFMTNWALDSEINKQKYQKDIIPDSKNDFWSTDYNIYFWEYARHYHCFSIKELEYIFKETGFETIENRLFENKRNYISILKKQWD